MTLNEIYKTAEQLKTTDKMPVLFVGHGSPMNAVQENSFTEEWKNIAASIPKPNAILTISAHWETRGTHVTINGNPPTIHDFGGFPKELFDVQYPAPGSPALAEEVINNVKQTEIRSDDKWGLDHGTWSVLKYFYPEADIPIVQMSLDYYQSSQNHYEIAKELAFLRKKGILIVGSGNIVHNLQMISWKRLDEKGFGYDWALEVDDKIKKLILSRDHQSLIKFDSLGKSFELAIPTPEHYLPMLYAIALQEENEKIKIFNDEAVGGSLTMTSLKIG